MKRPALACSLALTLGALVLPACGKKKSTGSPRGDAGATAAAAVDAGAAPVDPKSLGPAGPGGTTTASAPAAVSKAAVVEDVIASAQSESAALGTNTPAIAANAVGLKKDEIQDAGDFLLTIDPDPTPTRTAVGKVLAATLDGLNKVVKLPRDIPVRLGKCGRVNASYFPDSHSIVVCDEMSDLLGEMFSMYKEETDARRSTLGAMLFIFLHEMGHGLIDQFQLPSTGREEDAVDQLATLLLIAGGKDAVKVALDGAEAWLAIKVTRGDTSEDYWDEHSLDEQRFYNIVCLIFGSNPDEYTYMVLDGDLPRPRAMRCKDEYKKNYAAWDRLLTPYMGGAGTNPPASPQPSTQPAPPPAEPPTP